MSPVRLLLGISKANEISAWVDAFPLRHRSSSTSSTLSADLMDDSFMQSASV
jgi:hypothetical protein